MRPITCLKAALADRYTIEREVGHRTEAQFGRGSRNSNIGGQSGAKSACLRTVGRRIPPQQREANSSSTWRWSVVVLLLGPLGCASSSGGSQQSGEAEAPAGGPAMCFTLEVRNNSSQRVMVTIGGVGRLGSLSTNDRDVYVLPYRNAQLRVRFELQTGLGGASISNPVSPTPGDKIEIVFRGPTFGPGTLRRVGKARCSTG